MTLGILYQKFERRSKVLEEQFINYWTRPGAILKVEAYQKYEGLVSMTWQVWCSFCRELVIHSCLGATTVRGTETVLLPIYTTKERIIYAATKFANNQIPNEDPNTQLSCMRHEFNWGDIDKLYRSLNSLKPTNLDRILAGLALSENSIQHLQKIRNASAHITSENLTEVKRLAPYYVAKPLIHPVTAILWENKATQDPIFLNWINNMLIMANTMVQ